MPAHPPPPLPPLQDNLREVARVGLRHAPYSAVEAVALAVWYGTEVPDFSPVEGRSLTGAALLVERLRCYNVVPQARKRVLGECVRTLVAQVTTSDQAEFEQDYKRHLSRLQPLQSRHFVASVARS